MISFLMVSKIKYNPWNPEMAFLLVVIFLLVVVFSILPEILPGISRKLVDLTVEESEDEHVLRAEIKELNAHLQTISMVDEFAKYAKTQRKIQKLRDDLNRICKSKTEVFLKFKLGMNTVYHVIQLVCFLSIIYVYRHTPLIELPADWLTPLNKVISFPTGIPGALSVTFWIITCRSAMPRLVKVFIQR